MVSANAVIQLKPNRSRERAREHTVLNSYRDQLARELAEVERRIAYLTANED